MKLQGKRIVVTGSSFGIGRDIALLLGAQGASVVVNARGSGTKGKAAIDEVVEEIRAAGGTAIGVPGPVDDPRFATELVERCVAEFGGIDVLVNNAGILIPEALGPVHTCSIEAWEETIRVNFSGPFYTCRAALPHMIKQRWGRIINAGSHAGTGKMGGSGYSASKSGLFGFTRAIASDYGPYGITANVYNPEALTPMAGGIETFRNHLAHWEAKGFRTAAENRYAWDTGTGEGIAPWIAYLCLDESAYLNGRVFAVESRRIAMVTQPEEERVLFHNYGRNGPWSLDELSTLAPLAFPVQNAWPKREGDALAQWEKA